MENIHGHDPTPLGGNSTDQHKQQKLLDTIIGELMLNPQGDLKNILGLMKEPDIQSLAYNVLHDSGKAEELIRIFRQKQYAKGIVDNIADLESARVPQK